METAQMILFLRLLRWLGLRTLLSGSLLWLALLSIVWQLAVFIEPFDTTLMLALSTLGFGLGWWLARSRLSIQRAALITLIACYTMLGLWIGQLGDELRALLQAIGTLVISLIRAPATSPVTNPLDALDALQQAFFALSAAIGTLLTRTSLWLWSWFTAQPFFDPVASALVWGAALWSNGAWIAWAVRRRAQILPALLPAFALIAINGYLVYVNPWALLFLLCVMWPSLAILGQHTREVRWQQTLVDYSEEIRTDLAFNVVLLTLCLASLTAVLPAWSVQDIVRLVQRWSGPISIPSAPFGIPLESNPPVRISPFENIRSGGLPRRHLIGSGPELSQQLVMAIKTDDPSSAAPPRYHWRSFAYDRYTGSGWTTFDLQESEYPANDALKLTPLPTQRRLRQTIQGLQGIEEGISYLHVAGTLLVADQPYRVAMRSDDDLFGALLDTSNYRAESLIASVTITQLRATNSDYPAWVRARYLALPEGVPPRVLALARDLTATAPTPYDRARALEAYVRAFSYTLNLPAPPTNRDVADYFLFDLQRGYCDYYATTMVVLARAAGLPARFVIGYVSNRYDANNAQYIVTAADAHSWVEIYFPSVGWIEFEPTGGLPALSLQDEPITPRLDPITMPNPSRIAGNVWNVLMQTFMVLLMGLLLSGCIAFAWLLSETWRLQRLSPAAAVHSIYDKLYVQCQRLAVPLRSSDTSYEVIAAFTRHLSPLSQSHRTLLPIFREARWLTELHVRACFSTQPISPAESAQAITQWQNIRWRLWLARWWRLRQ